MSGVNKIIVVGRLGNNPEIKTFESGNKLATLSVATSESYKDKSTDEWKEDTEWHRVVVWGKRCDFIEKHAKKGMLVSLIGKNKTRSYEDANGVTKYTTEILANDFQILEKLESNGSSIPTPQEPKEQQSSNLPCSDIAEDDLLF